MKLKNIIHIVLLFVYGCKEDSNLKYYDTDQSFIYFSQTNPDRRGGEETLLYVDSLYFSFVFERDDVTEKTLALPVTTIGVVSAVERPFSILIDDKGTTIDRRLITIEKPVIRANAFKDSLYVNIKRDKILRDGIFTLKLKIQDNRAFRPGPFNNTTFKILITDQLTEPVWWTDWLAYFGPYKREVYQKWIEIYYPGLDTSPASFSDKPGYAWNNMPTYVSEANNPVTFLYIDRLKQYFEENVVYPNGDTTQPRIDLP